MRMVRLLYCGENMSQHPDIEAFYDKPQIIAIMKKAMLRLRQKKHTVIDIVNALQQRGIAMTRLQFDGMFLTRPERDISAPLPVFHAVIEILFGYDSQILTSADFFVLANAMRVPINELNSYARYFADTEWRTVITPFAGEFAHTPIDATISGRDTALVELFSQLVAHKNIIISGEAGVGKTVFASELMRMYERYYGQKTYRVNMRDIHSLAQLYNRLTQLLNITILPVTSMSRQINAMLQRVAPYIWLDGIDDYTHFGPDGLVTQLQAECGSVFFLITTRCVDVSLDMPQFYEYCLPPLLFHAPTDAGCVLYCQIASYVDRSFRASDYMLQACTIARGIPLNIVMLANTTSYTVNQFATDKISEIALHSLNQLELRIVALLSIMPDALSLRFFRHFGTQMFTINEHQMTTVIDGLVQRRIILRFGDESTYAYTIHVVIRDVITRLVGVNVLKNLGRDMANKLMRIDESWEDTFQSTRIVDVSDVVNARMCVEMLLDFQLYEDAALLLIHWGQMWRRYDMQQDIIVHIEQCIAACGETSPHIVGLWHLLGVAYLQIGAIDTATAYLSRALTAVSPTTQPITYAQVLIDHSNVIVTSMLELSSETIALVCQQMDTAIHLFATHHRESRRARALDQYSAIHWKIGNLRMAIEYNHQALNYFQTLNNSLGIFDVIINRGLILLYIGDFQSARTDLTNARQGYMRMQLPVWAGYCAMRLAVITLFESDAPALRRTLHECIPLMNRSWNISMCLYVIDLVAGLLWLEQQVPDSLALIHLCQRYRIESGIARGALFDVIVTQRIMTAQTLLANTTAQSTLFPPEMSLFDTIMIIQTML